MANVLTLWKCLMTWHTFWRHEALFDIMTNFLTSWCVLCFKANFWCCHDVFHDLRFIVLTFLSSFREQNILKNVFVMSLRSWYMFDFMTKCIFDVMPSFCIVLTFLFIISGTQYYENVCLMSLTLWYIFDFVANFWRHDKPFVIIPCFWHDDELFDVMANLLWYVFDIMTNFFDKLCDVMTCLWRHTIFFRCYDMFLTSWHTFLTYIDVMTNLLTSWRVFDVIDVFLTSWLTFWRLLRFLTTWHTLTSWRTTCFFYIMTNVLSWWRIFVIISGTKYNGNVISILLQKFWCYDMFW